MLITILSYGSRGDVQPYLALSLALLQKGHHVRLAAPAMFAPMVRQYSQDECVNAEQRIDFFPLPGDPAQLMLAAASPSLLSSLMPSPLRMSATVVRFITPIIPELIHEIRRACEGADFIIHTLLTSVIGHQIAQERNIHDISALIFPVFTETEQFPNPLFSPWPTWMRRFGKQAVDFGPRYNYLTHREFNRVFWYGNRIAINMLRMGSVNIPKLEKWPFKTACEVVPQGSPDHAADVLYGISPHVLSNSSDRPFYQNTTGYWFLDAPPDWQPPRALEDFLRNGPPPVFIGFGSVVSRQAKRLAQLMLEALRQTGQRGILLEGWGGLQASSLPDGVYLIDQIPYDWLFPRVAAVIHHGGMGTTADALRAGIPQMAIPFAFDQAFWGRQVYQIDIGPKPVLPRQLTTRYLTDAITAMVKDQELRQAAARLGETIRAENGLQNAVRMIEESFSAVR